MELGREGFGRRGRSGVWTLASVILFSVAVSVYSQNLVFNGNFGFGGGSFAGCEISHPNGDTNYPSYSPMMSCDGRCAVRGAMRD